MARRVAWQVTEEEAGIRLDAALSGRAEWLSRSRTQNAIRQGSVKVDGDIELRPSTTLSAESEVEAFLPEPIEADSLPVPADVPVSIVYSDDQIAVIDKPRGVSVHPGPGHTDNTLVNGLLRLFPQIKDVGDPARPGVVHRLDLDTSGLLVFALTPEAYASLGQAMRRREIRRTYTALVHGSVQPPEGTVDAPIGRDPSNRTRQAVVETGRPARTHYRTVESLQSATLLEVELETGRMHQIRVHMAAIGFPVLGDATYGRAPSVTSLDRQFLHASKLQFSHPESGEPFEAESPLPADLQAVLDNMRGN